MSRSLIVSIHDVAPPFAKQIDAILYRLKQLGVPRCSLLVVPDYHGGGRADRNPAWVAKLKSWQAEGHEMVLHGYFHRVEENGSPDLKNALLRNVYTASESEFLELDGPEAAKRLKLGLEVLGNAGLAPKGFVAPAWLMNGQVLKALGELGFEYTNTLKKIIDLKSGRDCDCWSQVYSSRSWWRRLTSVAWNECLWRRNRGREVVRISIHPPEIRYPMLWSHLESLVAGAVEGRKTLTYVEFVDRLRRGGA
jgi:predicted deacetylase